MVSCIAKQNVYEELTDHILFSIFPKHLLLNANSLTHVHLDQTPNYMHTLNNVHMVMMQYQNRN